MFGIFSTTNIHDTDDFRSIWSFFRLTFSNKLSAFFPWTVTVGIPQFPKQLLVSVLNGNFRKDVDIMMGTVKNDAMPFVYAIYKKRIKLPQKLLLKLNAKIFLGLKREEKYAF